MAKEVDIQILIDFRSDISITHQIVEQIYDQVEQGELKSGQQLPTVRDLADELKVNFNTVARAYRMLDQADIINTQHGRGTFVLPDTTPQTSERMEKLDRTIKDFLEELAKKDYSGEEILAAFQRNLRQMKHDDESSLVEQD